MLNIQSNIFLPHRHTSKQTHILVCTRQSEMKSTVLWLAKKTYVPMTMRK